MNASGDRPDHDFNRVCRTCLEEGEMKSLYDDCHEDLCIMEMLMTCTLVQFSEDDDLPRQICVKCIAEIQRCYNFAMKCQESDKILRSQIRVIYFKPKASSDPAKFGIPSKLTAPPAGEDPLKSKDIIDEVVETILPDSGPTTTEMAAPESGGEEDRLEQADITVSSDDDDFIADSFKPKKKPKKYELKSRPPYECKKCGASFPIYHQLKEHFKTANHKKYGYMKRQCTVCSKVISGSHMKMHMRIHTKEKPFCCEYCGKRFRISTNLIRHKRVHSGEKPYRCDLCGRCFTQSTRMQEHRRIHTGETKYMCNYCGKCFIQSANFRFHMKRHEAEDSGLGKLRSEVNERSSRQRNDYRPSSPLECNICNQSFKSSGGLKSHQVTHYEKNFVCPDCGRGFITNARLENHMKTHSDLKPYNCLICDKHFTKKHSLKSHLFIHSGEKPYPCTYCEKAFVQFGQLKYHLRTHSGERPYACKFCGKTFALNGNLTVHMRTHTGETPYVCPVCTRGFYDSSSMKKHLKSHGDGTTTMTAMTTTTTVQLVPSVNEQEVV